MWIPTYPPGSMLSKYKQLYVDSTFSVDNFSITKYLQLIAHTHSKNYGIVHVFIGILSNTRITEHSS